MAELRRPNRANRPTRPNNQGETYGTPTVGAMASIERARVARESAEAEKIKAQLASEKANEALVKPVARRPASPRKVIVSKAKSSIELQAKAEEKAIADAITKATAKAIADARLVGKPVQKASPSDSKRMAGTIIRVTPEDVIRYTEKYKDMPQDRSKPNFIGRSLPDWKIDNADIRKGTIERIESGASDETIHQYLFDKGFRSLQERKAIIGEIYAPRLRNERYSVANADADEFLSRQVLRHSGFKPVKPANQDMIMGTDIRATVDGVDHMIDAQARVNNSGALNIQVASGRDLDLIAQRNRDKPLIDVISDAARHNPYLHEGKLMHTPDDTYNPIQSERFMAEQSDNTKDFLISSDRSGDWRRGLKKGPYNRELPKGWELIDLQVMREQLLRQSLNQLQARNRIRLNDYENEINLSIPSNKLQMFHNSSLMLPDSVTSPMSIAVNRWN